MKKILPLVLLALAATAASAQAQEDCPPYGSRVFQLFDVNVHIPRPESEVAADTMRWRRLFRVSTGYMEWYYNTQDLKCAPGLAPRPAQGDLNPVERPEYFDNWETIHRAGGESPIAVDYLVYGTMLPNDDGIPEVTAWVVTGRTHIPIYKTRKMVLPDSDPYESGQFMLSNENLLKVTTNFPFYPELIANWEIKRRDEMPNGAVNPKIELKVDNSELQAGDSTRIHIRVIDADSVPLKNRKLGINWNERFGTISGQRFSTDADGYMHAITDDDGRVELMLKAGEVRGGTSLKVDWNYERPSERVMYASDWQPITIIGPKWNGSIALRLIETQDLVEYGTRPEDPSRVDTYRESTTDIIASITDGSASSRITGRGSRTQSWFHDPDACVAVGTPGNERTVLSYSGGPQTRLTIEPAADGQYQISIVPPVITEKAQRVRDSNPTFCGGGHKESVDELPYDLQTVTWLSSPQELALPSHGQPVKLQLLQGRETIYDVKQAKGGTRSRLVVEWSVSRVLQ